MPVEEVAKCSQYGKTADVWWFWNFDTFSTEGLFPRLARNKPSSYVYHIASFGPRQRSAFDRLSKEGGLSLRSEGAVNSTLAIRQSRAGMMGKQTQTEGSI